MRQGKLGQRAESSNKGRKSRMKLPHSKNPPRSDPRDRHHLSCVSVTPHSSTATKTSLPSPTLAAGHSWDVAFPILEALSRAPLLVRTHLILSRLRDLFCAAVISPVLFRLVYTEKPLFLNPNSLATWDTGKRDKV